MSAIDILGLLIPATYLLMLAVEAGFPARTFPQAKGWRWMGFGFFLLFGFVTTETPLLLPQDWLARHRLMDGSWLGVAGGAIVGYVVLSFISFLWHRSAHEFGPLWRGFHQIHHSPQRVDMSGAALFHPLEMAVFALQSVIATTIILGLDPLAAAITGYIASFYSFFQHLNVRTPRWLGYVIQRPESHCIHHQRGLHAFNYADLPIWDMLFGSFRNPASYEGAFGFDAPANKRFGAMLAFVDVNAPIEGPNSLGRARGAG
ncbi:MAG TPA: sterol desaturase family protein [Rhizomicrobium sp.]|jgi:sterol desaturase/sphingolipid hydroxylase (fatty acid hydroxylase superfamily)